MNQATSATIDCDQFSHWNRQMTELLSASPCLAQVEELVSALGLLVPTDGHYLAIFRHDGPPVELLGPLLQPGTPYDKGPYLLDPFFEIYLAKQPPACFRLRDIAPDNFHRSEYFTTFYRALRIHDEVGYVLPWPDLTAGHFSLIRSAESRRFRARHLAILNAVLPVVDMVLRRVWAASQKNKILADIYATALENPDGPIFGQDALTRRQQELARLLLKGHSAKSAAKAMNIAPGTARNHIRGIYERLSVSSRGELFNRFLSEHLQGTSSPPDERSRTHGNTPNR